MMSTKQNPLQLMTARKSDMITEYIFCGLNSMMTIGKELGDDDSDVNYKCG